MSAALRWPWTLATFAVLSALAMAGIWWGPAQTERDAFALPDDPTWQANERAERDLPSPDTQLFLFVAGQSEASRGNVLRLDVLRAMVARGDRVRADPLLGPLFEPKTLSGGQVVQGPFGFPEVIRGIMDGDNPMVLWEGPGFMDAQARDLHTLLDRLFAVEGNGDSHPYRAPFAPDLVRGPDGTWHSTGMLHPILAARTKVERAIEGGGLQNIEDFELRVDAIYAEPLPGEVQVWSYAGFDAQIDAQVEENTPLVLLALLAMMGLVGVFLRSWRDAVVVAVSLVLLFGWIAGFQGWLGFPSTQLSSMLPILIVALAVDFYLHTAKRWRRLGSVPESIASLRRPLGLATVTSAVAFGTAMASPVPTLAEWGVLAVLAVPSAYLLLGVFAPTLRSGLGKPPSGSVDSEKTAITSAARLLFRARLVIVGAALCLTVGALAVGRPSAGFDAGDYLDPTSRLMQTLQMDQRTFPNLGAPGVILVEGQSLTDEEKLGALEAFSARLPELGAARSDEASTPTLTDIAQTHEGTGQAIRDHLVRTSREGLRGPFGQIELSPEQLRGIYRVEGGRITATKIPFGIPDADDWAALGALRERIEAGLEGLRSSGVSATVTGSNYVQFAFINRLTESFDRSTLLAAIACALVVILVFRRWRPALVVLLPVAAACAAIQAVMALADIRLNIISVQVLSLAVGLGLDYSIHMTQALIEARRDAPDAPHTRWISAALAETGSALGGSAVTTLVGFGLLAASPMNLFRSFGGLMMLAIGLSALAAMVLVPALFSLLAPTHPGDGVVEDLIEADAR